jgi:hypothetical protein
LRRVDGRRAGEELAVLRAVELGQVLAVGFLLELDAKLGHLTSAVR